MRTRDTETGSDRRTPEARPPLRTPRDPPRPTYIQKPVGNQKTAGERGRGRPGGELQLETGGPETRRLHLLAFMKLLGVEVRGGRLRAGAPAGRRFAEPEGVTLG